VKTIVRVVMLAAILLMAQAALAQQDVVVGGNIAGAGQTVTASLLNLMGSARVTVTGTFSQTLVVQCSGDGGTNFTNLFLIDAAGAAQANITAAGTFTTTVAGCDTVQVTPSVYTSGTATVTIRISTATGFVWQQSAPGGGGSTVDQGTAGSSAWRVALFDGSNAVATATTVPGVSDRGLVVRPAQHDTTATGTVDALDEFVEIETSGAPETAIRIDGTYDMAFDVEGQVNGQWAQLPMAYKLGAGWSAFQAQGTYLVMSAGMAKIRVKVATYNSGSADLGLRAHRVGTNLILGTVILENTATDGSGGLYVAPSPAGFAVGQAGSWTVTGNQGAANSLANAWPTKISDGTDLALVSGSGSLQVTCDNCGGSSFLDNASFTFGTTPVSPFAAVVDDVGTNTVAENSAGAPRMSDSRVLYSNLRTATGTEIPLPAALGANGGLKVEGVAGGTAVPISGTVNQGSPNSAANRWPVQPTNGTYSAGVTDNLGWTAINMAALAVRTPSVSTSGSITGMGSGPQFVNSPAGLFNIYGTWTGTIGFCAMNVGVCASTDQIEAYNLATGAWVQTISGNGTYYVAGYGGTGVAAYPVAWTSGTATMTITGDWQTSQLSIPIRRSDSNGNLTPAMDAVTRAGFQKVTDGVYSANVGNTAGLWSANRLGVQLVPSLGSATINGVLQALVVNGSPAFVAITGTWSGTLTFGCYSASNIYPTEAMIFTSGVPGGFVTSTASNGQFIIPCVGGTRSVVTATAWTSGTASLEISTGTTGPLTTIRRSDTAGFVAPAMDAAGRAGFQKITDGTETANVNANNQLEVAQGKPISGFTDAWPIKITDGGAGVAYTLPTTPSSSDWGLVTREAGAGGSATSLLVGSLAATTTAQALAGSTACVQVTIQNDPTATVDILVGNSSTQTVRLSPGMSITLNVTNLNVPWVKTASGTASVPYIGR
jgi:hypothetical protein